MKLAIQGALLFAFIPLVLFFYLRQPLGPGLSIALGVAIMFGHRFVAAPWLMRHAQERCLWCGRSGALDHRFVVRTGGREQPVVACSPAHANAVAHFLTFTARARLWLAVAIFVPLLLLIAGTLALVAGHPFIPPAWNAWQFKTIVAVAVVTSSLAYRLAEPALPLSSPFPLHNLFLLGIGNTLWVFRLVGAWWIVAGTLQWVRRG